MNQKNEKIHNTLAEIKISKQELLDVIKKNREIHEKAHEEAEKIYWALFEDGIEMFEKKYWMGYRKLKKDALRSFSETRQQIRSVAEKGNEEPTLKVSSSFPNPTLNLPPRPVSHAGEYERLETWLKLSVENEIVLDPSQFDKYVMDNWEFKNELSNNYTRMITGGLALNAKYGGQFASGSMLNYSNTANSNGIRSFTFSG